MLFSSIPMSSERDARGGPCLLAAGFPPLPPTAPPTITPWGGGARRGSATSRPKAGAWGGW